MINKLYVSKQFPTNFLINFESRTNMSLPGKEPARFFGRIVFRQAGVDSDEDGEAFAKSQKCRPGIPACNAPGPPSFNIHTFRYNHLLITNISQYHCGKRNYQVVNAIFLPMRPYYDKNNA
jgi:hypothetical protein